MATFKHISSKNADYGAAEQYLTFEHDEFTMKPTLDKNGRLLPRDDYRISSLNCGDEDFAIACMRSNLKYGKNQKREDVKSHHYIISFDPRDAADNGLTVDRAQQLGEEDREDDDIPEKDVEEDMEENMEEEMQDEPEVPRELACRTEKGYFTVQESPGGYDYAFYGEDYRTVDRGEYENQNPDMRLEDVMDELLEAEGFCVDQCIMEDYGEIMEKVREIEKSDMETFQPVSGSTGKEAALNGQSRAEIEEMVLCYAQAQLEDAGLDGNVEILAARVYGSRTREGLYREDSDIDVVVSYIGGIREDTFFNILNGEGLKIAGLPVDMNPISMEKTGTLEEYLARAEKYLDSRELQLKSGRAEPESAGSMEAGQAAGNEERRSVLAALKEKQSAIGKRENIAEGSKEYKKRGQEL